MINKKLWNKKSLLVDNFLNISISYLATVLFFTIIHLESKPINSEDLELATANQFEMINIAARNYIHDENWVRIMTVTVLCEVTPSFYRTSMFDKTDREICRLGESKAPEWLAGRIPK